MQLTVNGIDFSELMTKYGYAVGYNEIEGSNTVTTLDGTTHYDILARKAVVTVLLRPLKSASLSSIVTLCANDQVSVSYFDTKTNAIRTTTMKPALSSANVALINTDTYWGGGQSGIVLTLEEL